MPRLLIISRDRKETAFLRESLIREGYEVGTAPPEESLFEETLTRLPPDLILYHLDGDPERITRLRQRLTSAYERKDIPILVLAGDVAISRLDVACGMDDFLVTPLKMPEKVTAAWIWNNAPITLWWKLAGVALLIFSVGVGFGQSSLYAEFVAKLQPTKTITTGP